MKKLIYILLLFPFASFAQTPTFQDEFNGNMDFHKNQILLLIDAIPDDKITWRSSDEVRSISEVVAHIAASTYQLGSFLGHALPEGLDPSTFEKTILTKDELKKVINESFAYMKTASETVTEEDLTTQVELPFGTFSKRAVMMVILSHNTQHKGQFIAYARFIDVTPPWNADKGEDTGD